MRTIKYIAIFLAWLSVIAVSVYAYPAGTTLTADITNLVQYIKKVVITANGTPNGTAFITLDGENGQININKESISNGSSFNDRALALDNDGNVIYTALPDGGGGLTSTDVTATIGEDFAVPHSFSNADGDPSWNSSSYAGVTEHNGVLYGVTFAGWAYTAGTIFSFNPVNSVYTTLYSFDVPSGSWPMGTLVFDGDVIYGTTYEGWTDNYGTIFSYDLSNNTYTDLYNFVGTEWAQPGPGGGGLTMVDGILYGLAGYGWAHENGVLFSFNPTNNTYTDLHDFNDALYEWAYPGSRLIELNGILYGIAGWGWEGSPGNGTLFSYDITNNIFAKIYDFDEASGDCPVDSLTLFNNIFYGTVMCWGWENNDGGIFSFDPSDNSYTLLSHFNQGSRPEDGYSPVAALTVVNNILYSYTMYGWADNNGVIFSFDPSDNSYTRLYDFDNNGGWMLPGFAPLVLLNGSLYGTTIYGWASNMGEIFRYTPAWEGNEVRYEFFIDGNGQLGVKKYLNSILVRSSLIQMQE